MPDIRDRFATLDRTPMPELWSDIERRAADLGSAERLTSVTVRMSDPPTGHGDRTMARLVAAGLVVVLIGGAVAVGTGLVRMPAIVPAPVVSPSPTPSPSISSSPAAIAPAVRAPWIVFGVHAASGDRRSALWAMRSDGSGSHEILGAGCCTVAWSHDGSRLLMNDGSINVAEVDEAIGPFVDTGVDVPRDSQWEAFDFAPDGERVVYVERSKCAKNGPGLGVAPPGMELAMLVADTAGANCWVLGILDLRTGELTRLGKTLVKDQVRDQNLALELPAWSPDGTNIAYTRLDQATDRRELWVVNADGTDPSRIALSADVSPREPRWSPDGTRISFTSVTWPSVDRSESTVYVADLASGGLERITTGSSPTAGQLCCADWLDDTHLRVQGAAATETNRFWSVTLDVIPHESEVLFDLTGAFATDAPGPAITYSAPGDPGRTLYWQPIHDGPG